MIRKLVLKWLKIDVLCREIDSLTTKSREHDKDIVSVMDEQLKLRQQYPLVDTMVVPTDEQVITINEGGPDGTGKNL
jgi:hypothetical protein